MRRSRANASAFCPSASCDRTEVEYMNPVSVSRLHAWGISNANSPTIVRPAAASTAVWGSSARCWSRFAGTLAVRRRDSASSDAVCPPSTCCHGRLPSHGELLQSSATWPPGTSQRVAEAAMTRRCRRWNAFPIVTRSNELSASTSSARPTIHRTLSTPRARAFARANSMVSGSWSTAQTSAKSDVRPKVIWPVPHARSNSRPAPVISARTSRSSRSDCG